MVPNSSYHCNLISILINTDCLLGPSFVGPEWGLIEELYCTYFSLLSLKSLLTLRVYIVVRNICNISILGCNAPLA